jgi:hypothetical protein
MLFYFIHRLSFLFIVVKLPTRRGIVDEIACFANYCLTDLTVDSSDITVLVSGEQKHYFHL